ncbi:MAG: tRNA uridine(34) 5-carboxymethylaminomethyl modification radical SAM/GNAT enzyme Elp3 [Candidatus Thermoplasmatota archaeon]|nr:tRNA uridine(34) 5-carboxymethylaminomethyl modification radical SAM/GNAT enzyme Elp3 [Candidatus Thermoplasmatota archaeon]
MDFFSEVSSEIESGRVRTKDQLQKLKMEIARKYSLDHIPGDSDILAYLHGSEDTRKILTIKGTRTISGVAVVAAMTSPERCPHGKCIFCPGGPDNNSPQAYTGYEPAALRGRNNGYDPYNEVFNRLKQLETIGHDTSKVDLIIMGGTFTAREPSYQMDFVKGCLDGMNRNVSRTLEEAILENENAERRCIGLTVETKPDWFLEKDIDLALSYGATKVELGVQILKDDVLRMNNRGHGIEEIRRSTALARDAGLKIVYHIMPGMYGTSMEDDYGSFDLMFSDPSFRPDMLKIYPTLVVKGTSLYKLWKDGKYVPPATDEMVDFLVYVLEKIPPWVRIQRIQRDIPVRLIAAGVKRSDIRNLAEERIRKLTSGTGEIRYREIGRSSGRDSITEMRRIDYDASGGREIFLSFETGGSIVGFLRLRIPSEESHRQELTGSSIVREIKVFGREVPIGKHDDQWQHRGIGKEMIFLAENITREEFGLRRIAIMSGIGVRNYFRTLGYEILGPYMAKAI